MRDFTRWRHFDETSFNQQIRFIDKMTDAGSRLVDRVHSATNYTSNTDPYSINDWKERHPWYSFTIETPKGRLLKGVLLNDNDTGEKIELMDVRIWWEPIPVSTRTEPREEYKYSKVWENIPNAKKLVSQYASWKNKKDTTLRINDDETIDDFLDKRYDALKKEYLKLFKEYSQARPDQRWDKTDEVVEALIKYSLLNK